MISLILILFAVALVCIAVACLAGVISILGVAFDFLIGALAGYFAGRIAGSIMDSQLSLWGSILLGVIGSFVGNLLCSLLGFVAAGTFAQFVVSVVGACVCIWLGRKLFQ